MKICYFDLLVELQEISEKIEFEKSCQSIPVILVVDKNYSCGSTYNLMVVSNALSGKVVFALGLEMVYHGIKPKILLCCDRKAAYIGCGMSIMAIDLASNSIERSLDLNSPFYGFMQIEETKSVLAFYELGIFSFSSTGVVEWHHATSDVLSRWEITTPGMRMEITLMDGQKMSLDLMSGESV